MTNIIPFERKRAEYVEAVTANVDLMSINKHAYSIRAAYNILTNVMEDTTSNHLKNDINCVLGCMRTELEYLRDDSCPK